jgi:hypothetical protein
MTLRLSLSALIGSAMVLVLGRPAPSGEKKETPDPSAPGPEHKVLERLVGSYDAKVKLFFEPGKLPEESLGTMKRKMLFGGRYLQEEFEGKMGDMPFTGMGLIGYDKFRKKYVVSWIDSMSTGFMTSDGSYDAAKRTFTYRSDDVDPVTGMKMKGRDLLRLDSDDQQTFEMYRQPVEEGAQEIKVLEIIYTRRK